MLPAGDAALLVELADLAHTLALYRELVARPIAGVRELIPAARTLLLHYRPEAIAPAQLAAALRARAAALDAPGAGAAAASPGRLVEIPVHYAGEDLAEVAELMGVPVRELIARHTGQPWQAAFAGFAPGFVYLAGGHPSFRIPRRKAPRTRVPAGSVALAGDFSAVYPAASPGGWQLIGVTGVPMWDLQRAEPAYVQPGFRVQFRDAGAAALRVSLPAAAKAAQQPATADAGIAPAASAPAAATASAPAAAAAPAAGSESPSASESASAAASAAAAAAAAAPAQAQAQPAGASIEFEATGLQTLVQDAGRHGLAGLGISPSGALDQRALRAANRLVGNPVHAPVLEHLLGGLRLRCHGPATVAVTGARAALTLHAPDGRQWSLPVDTALALDDGDRLSLGPTSAGVRCYLAVRGGWQVEPVLGSCATDTLAQVGPPALRPGDRLAVGRALPPGQLRAGQPEAAAPPALPRPGELVTLDALPGPRADWFEPEALALLAQQTWRVTPQSNRIGVRLEGERPLPRCRHDELPSEGTVSGAIQVPAGGQPVLFLADHPLTGGYPVIACVASHHLDLAAQLPVGCGLRLRLLDAFTDPGDSAPATQERPA